MVKQAKTAQNRGGIRGGHTDKNHCFGCVTDVWRTVGSVYQQKKINPRSGEKGGKNSGFSRVNVKQKVEKEMQIKTVTTTTKV